MIEEENNRTRCLLFLNEFSDELSTQCQDSNKKINWKLILKAYNFNIDFLKDLNIYNLDSIDSKNISDILENTFEQNAYQTFKMIRYIIIHYTYFYEETTNFSIDIMNMDLNELCEEITLNSKDNIKNNGNFRIKKAFISYSNNNKKEFKRIKKLLCLLGIEYFIAHDDINPSDNWMNNILKELGDTDIFIAIISDDFNKSAYCMQEVGIAKYRKILIIPISIDGKTPEGFLHDTQCCFANKESYPGNILNILIEKDRSLLDNLINKLNSSTCFKDSITILELLSNLFNTLTLEEITKISTIIIKNDQIYNCNGCVEYIHDFLNINQNEIPQELLEKIRLKYSRGLEI